MIVYTSYRNYPFPDSTEDLKTSNTVLNEAFNKIDLDINDLYTIKAEIDDENTLTEKTWSSSKIDSTIDEKVSDATTAEEILEKIKTVDGVDSGLDADLLDGVDSSSFARTDLSNVSDSDILSKIKNVDGSGSGLDADTLDGLDSGSFVKTSDYDDSDVLNKIKNVDGSGSGLDADLLDGLDSGSFVKTTDYEDSDILNKIKNVDGSGSELDADTLDGLESTQFTRKDVAETRTGDLTFNSETNGVVLIDRSDTSKKYRLYIDAGALHVEEVV